MRINRIGTDKDKIHFQAMYFPSSIYMFKTRLSKHLNMQKGKRIFIEIKTQLPFFKASTNANNYSSQKISLLNSYY
jgi:hypothetical protein